MGVLKALKLKDLVTLTGTFCGVFSIMLSCVYDAPRAAGGFIFLGLIMDLLDGYVARKTNQMNELGKELDSLSDSLVFGVAPAIMIFCEYTKETTTSGIAGWSPIVMLFPTFIFIIGAILRLAWFNIDDNEGYTGLVTPLSASFLVLLHYIDYFWLKIPNTGVGFAYFMKYAIPVLMIGIAYSNVTPYIAYGKTIRKKQGFVKYIFVIFGVLGLVVMIFGFVSSLATAAAPFVFGIIIFMIAFLGYYIAYGYKNYKHLKANPETDTQKIEKTEKAE